MDASSEHFSDVEMQFAVLHILVVARVKRRDGRVKLKALRDILRIDEALIEPVMKQLCAQGFASKTDEGYQLTDAGETFWSSNRTGTP